MQQLKTALNKIMTYRIKVFILTDSVEMLNEANNSYVTPVGNNLSSILFITLKIFSFVTHTWHLLLATS
jgi:hypothetical protein